MRRSLLAAALAATAIGTPVLADEGAAAATAADIEFEQMGAYVVADDLAAAKAFYSELLGLDPVFENPVFIGFYIEGGLLGIASRAQFAQEATIGGNVVPYIRVKDIDAAFAHAQSVAADRIETPEVVREGPIAIFKLRDPDGNLVEFYSFDSAAGSSSNE